MKRIPKVLLTLALSAAIHVLLFMFVSGGGEDDVMSMAVVFASAVFTVIGIPVGIAFTLVIERAVPVKKTRNYILMGVALVWGLLFGWLSLLGVAAGQYMVETEDDAAPSAPHHEQPEKIEL